MARPRGSKNKPKTETTVTEAVTENVESPKEEEIKPAAPPAYQKRHALLKEISDSNKERYIADGELPAEDIPLDESEEPQAEPETSEPEVKAEPEPKQEPPPKQKFIVDGVEKEFSEEEIKAFVQKGAFADQRIREANRLLEDAKRASAPTRETERPTAHLPAATSSADDAGTEQEIVQKISKALMYGDEEKVTEAVSVLLGKGRHGMSHANMATQIQGMTPQQVQAHVQETLAFERGKQLLETPPEQGGYADIWGDPKLRIMFSHREAELRDVQKDTRSYPELFKAICEEIREWRDSFIKQHTPKTGLEDREAAKRSTGVVRGAGGKSPAPIERKPKSHDETISGMRASRGLN